jgi:hypothetical protein
VRRAPVVPRAGALAAPTSLVPSTLAPAPLLAAALATTAGTPAAILVRPTWPSTAPLAARPRTIRTARRAAGLALVLRVGPREEALDHERGVGPPRKLEADPDHLRPAVERVLLRGPDAQVLRADEHRTVLALQAEPAHVLEAELVRDHPLAR